jgi:hypothetical protein
MRRNFFRFLVGLSAVFTLLVVSDAANAQNNRRESRGRNLTKAQVKVIINRVETRVDNFVKNYDKALDTSKLDGTSREDWLNKRAKDLEKATDELRREFDRRDAWIENKDEVRNCLKIASDIDHNMRSHNFGTATKANWDRVRYELNSLADVYNLPRVAAYVYS